MVYLVHSQSDRCISLIDSSFAYQDTPPDNEMIYFVFVLVMVALCNRETIYIFILFLILLSSFFSSPNLSSRRLDVYHTSAHGVVLV